MLCDTVTYVHEIFRYVRTMPIQVQSGRFQILCMVHRMCNVTHCLVASRGVLSSEMSHAIKGEDYQSRHVVVDERMVQSCSP